MLALERLMHPPDPNYQAYEGGSDDGPFDGIHKNRIDIAINGDGCTRTRGLVARSGGLATLFRIRDEALAGER